MKNGSREGEGMWQVVKAESEGATRTGALCVGHTPELQDQLCSKRREVTQDWEGKLLGADGSSYEEKQLFMWMEPGGLKERSH